jgi:ABC-type cobalamin/Fe3+-siderophores transport system ATPase subunit
MIIIGQNGVGKSTLLYAVKESIMKNVVRDEDVIFISQSWESDQLEYAQANESSTKIASVLNRLEIARRNIIAASSLLDNKNIAEYTAYQMFMSL